MPIQDFAPFIEIASTVWVVFLLMADDEDSKHGTPSKTTLPIFPVLGQ
jgi:hypothetical protein